MKNVKARTKKYPFILIDLQLPCIYRDSLMISNLANF